jgi:hypothetical protein
VADIKIDGTDSTKINLDVDDSNDLVLNLTGGDKGLRLHMLETIYPVGSIYINAGVATNPGTLLGFGTWSAFGTGRTIIGVDSSDTDFDAVRETGGTKTHTLTVAEIPAHTHSITVYNESGSPDGYVGGDSSSTEIGTPASNSTGGGGAHTIVQPYITAYMWRRTA